MALTSCTRMRKWYWFVGSTTCTTSGVWNPACSTALRTADAFVGPSNASSTSVPPLKSVP